MVQPIRALVDEHPQSSRSRSRSKSRDRDLPPEKRRRSKSPLGASHVERNVGPGIGRGLFNVSSSSSGDQRSSAVEEILPSQRGVTGYNSFPGTFHPTQVPENKPRGMDKGRNDAPFDDRRPGEFPRSNFGPGQGPFQGPPKDPPTQMRDERSGPFERQTEFRKEGNLDRGFQNQQKMNDGGFPRLEMDKESQRGSGYHGKDGGGQQRRSEGFRGDMMRPMGDTGMMDPRGIPQHPGDDDRRYQQPQENMDWLRGNQTGNQNRPYGNFPAPNQDHYPQGTSGSGAGLQNRFPPNQQQDYNDGGSNSDNQSWSRHEPQPRDHTTGGEQTSRGGVGNNSPWEFSRGPFGIGGGNLSGSSGFGHGGMERSDAMDRGRDQAPQGGQIPGLNDLPMPPAGGFMSMSGQSREPRGRHSPVFTSGGGYRGQFSNEPQGRSGRQDFDEMRGAQQDPRLKKDSFGNQMDDGGGRGGMGPPPLSLQSHTFPPIFGAGGGGRAEPSDTGVMRSSGGGDMYRQDNSSMGQMQQQPANRAGRRQGGLLATPQAAQAHAPSPRQDSDERSGGRPPAMDPPPQQRPPPVMPPFPPGFPMLPPGPMPMNFPAVMMPGPRPLLDMELPKPPLPLPFQENMGALRQQQQVGPTTATDCYAVVSNLPKPLHRYNTLKQFFHPLDLRGKDTVKMIFDSAGENLGLAYIKFMNPNECRQFDDARDGPPPSFTQTLMNSRNQGFGQQYDTGGRFVVELRNVPYKATRDDVAPFLGRLRPTDLQKIFHRDGQPSDRWFAQFGTFQEFDECLRKDGETVMGRNVIVKRSDAAEMQTSVKNSGYRPSGSDKDRDSRGPDRERVEEDRRRSRDHRRRTRSRSRERRRERTPPRKERTRSKSPVKDVCVYLSGMPHTITERNIAALLDGCRIASSGIRLMKQPSGTAYVELVDTKDCEKALKKDRHYMGSQSVSIKSVSKQAMQEAIAKQFQSGFGSGQNGGLPMGIRARKDPPSTPAASSSQNPRGTSSDKGKGNEKKVDGGRKMKSPTLSEQQTALGPPPGATPIDPAVVLGIGQAGCVVAVHGLPPRISLEELCQFFQGHEILDDSVRMHYNDAGEPTGDCLLAIKTPEDTVRAVAKLNASQVSGHTVKTSMYE